MREWCGQLAREQFAELQGLRDEVVRLGQLVESGATALRAAGADKAADRLKRELGVPVDVVRAKREQQERDQRHSVP